MRSRTPHASSRSRRSSTTRRVRSRSPCPLAPTPLIPLGRLRASGDLIEIRAADLAFTEHETEEGVNGVAGLSLTEADLTVLYEHTEGWPVGVHLASLGLRTTDDPTAFLRSFGGSNRYVMDYLTEVVVDSLDEDLGSFLLETSILRRLNGSLCDAVTGRDDSAAMLEGLYRSNVFVIPQDDDRRWYRYHHLFGELLAERLRAQFPSRVPELHKAAALWLKETGDVGEAILHSIAAENSKKLRTWSRATGLRWRRAGGSSPSSSGSTPSRTDTLRARRDSRSPACGRWVSWVVSPRRNDHSRMR